TLTTTISITPYLPHFLTTLSLFFFNATATTEIYTLSLHDALPISCPLGIGEGPRGDPADRPGEAAGLLVRWRLLHHESVDLLLRSEEHTSELQSRGHLVCRLLLEKKKKLKNDILDYIICQFLGVTR